MKRAIHGDWSASLPPNMHQNSARQKRISDKITINVSERTIYRKAKMTLYEDLIKITFTDESRSSVPCIKIKKSIT